MSYNIILIDDNVIDLTITKKILTSAGYNVLKYTDSQKAIDYIKKNSENIHLIISDYYMPKIDGITLLKLLKKDQKISHIPFIFISNGNKNDLEIDSIKYGAIDFISKPINKKMFLTKISSILNSLFAISLKQGKVLETTNRDLTIQDSLLYCKEEKIKGFILIYTDKNNYGIIKINAGDFDEIIYNKYTGIKALEKLESLKKYNIAIYNIPFHHALIETFFSNKKDWSEKKTKIQTNKKNTKKIKQKEVKMDVSKLNEIMDKIKSDLGEGLIASAIWSVNDAQAIISYNPQPKSVALIDRLTNYLQKSLADADFPALNRYFVIDLSDNKLMVVVPLGDFRWGTLVNSESIQLGLLLNIIIPDVTKKFKEAINS